MELVSQVGRTSLKCWYAYIFRKKMSEVMLKKKLKLLQRYDNLKTKLGHIITKKQELQRHTKQK